MRTPRTRPPAKKVTHTPSASGRARTAANSGATGNVSRITRRITREISADRRAAMRELANR